MVILHTCSSRTNDLYIPLLLLQHSCSIQYRLYYSALPNLYQLLSTCSLPKRSWSITMYLSLKSASQMVSEQQKCSFPNLSQQRAPAAAEASPLLAWTGEGVASRAGDGIFALFSTVHGPGPVLVPPVRKTHWKMGEGAMGGYHCA